MALSDQQYEFAQDLILFLQWLVDRKIKFTIGEVWRRQVTQKWLMDKGWSDTMKSGHRDKLAADIFIWLEGRFAHNTWENRDKLIAVSDKWKSLSPLNTWGGDWTIGGRPDIAHYERKRE